MDKEKFCPLFVDYVRECLYHVEALHWEIATVVNLCTSGGHKDCPFFRFIEQPSEACEYFKESPLREHIKHINFDEFMELSNKWCLGDFASCARYKIRKSGGNPDSNTHPNGKEIIH